MRETEIENTEARNEAGKKNVFNLQRIALKIFFQTQCCELYNTNAISQV